MKKRIAIIGSTGSTGKELVKLALVANYSVTLVERSQSTPEEDNLSVLRGDVTDLQSLVAAFKDIDYVISCFGPSNHKNVGTLMSEGTANIVKACEENNIEKLVFMSGFVQSDGSEFSPLNRCLTKTLQSYYKDSFNDKVIAELAIQESKLNWVIVRAVALKQAKPLGKYNAGVKLKVSPFSALTYIDCAVCLLDAIHESKWSKQIINVGK